jgi:hypothetical protein
MIKFLYIFHKSLIEDAWSIDIALLFDKDHEDRGGIFL